MALERDLYLWVVRVDEVPRGGSQFAGTTQTAQFMYEFGRAVERNGIDVSYEFMDYRVMRVRTSDTGYTMLRLLYGERFTVWPRVDNDGPPMPTPPPVVTPPPRRNLREWLRLWRKVW